jgi:hypothetical protein
MYPDDTLQLPIVDIGRDSTPGRGQPTPPEIDGVNLLESSKAQQPEASCSPVFSPVSLELIAGPYVPRGSPAQEKPWCWQPKEARRRIRDQLDGTEEIASALSIYDALTEIASDKGAPVFETTQAYIAMIAGLADRSSWALCIMLQRPLRFTAIRQFLVEVAHRCRS